MATAKCDNSADIINGLATVNVGAKLMKLYDNTQRTQHIASATGIGTLTNIDARYKYHGGVSGSGNWEH